MKHLRFVALAVVAGALLLGACGDDDDTSSAATTAKPASTLSGDLTVSAAASLTEAFGQIDKDFVAANPKVSVKPTFDSSSTLVTQIQSGAPADVFASADQDNMQKITAANLDDGAPVVFAKNNLIIVTKPGNPKNVKSVADLATVGVVSLCGVDVPCGKYAQQVLDNAHVTIPPDKITRGQNAKTTVAAVAQGDADAGIVYVTDAKASGDQVSTVTIPADQNVVAIYPIATLKAATAPATAKAYVDFVMSDSGQATLKKYGFLAP